MEKKRGLFVIADGCDGAGKSTQLKLISQFLNQVGIQHVSTREPGGTDIAEDIRACLLKNKDKDLEEPIYPMTELLLVSAARYQHIHNKILTSLENGDWVLCDRFNDSTWAYQGYAGNVNMSHLSDIEDIVQGTFKPDYVFMFHVDIKVAAARMSGRSDNNGFDEATLEYKERLRAGFNKRMDRDSKTTYISIDGSGTVEEVNQRIRDELVYIIDQWENQHE